MNRVIISGIGVEIPEATITNDELVASFNEWIDKENSVRAARGEDPLPKSDSDFIVYASGVKNRHVLVREGILDVDRMSPDIPHRDDGEGDRGSPGPRGPPSTTPRRGRRGDGAAR